jgi:transcriptional regulator with XRE-family HTH domain
VAQRPKQLTPNASPAHFWGAELRARRVSRGLSLEDLGRIVHRDRSYLAKIERGERAVSAEIARECDRALGDDGTLVRLHTMVTASADPHAATPAPGPDVATGPADVAHVANTGLHVARAPDLLAPDTPSPAPLEQEGEEISIPVRTPDGRVIFVSVSRRMFLGGVGATAGLATLAPAAQPSGIASAHLSGAAAAPDMHPAAHFEQMRHVLIDSDNLFGPEQVIQTVKGQLQLIGQLRQSLRGADQRSLLEMQAKYAELASWLYQDYGDLSTAERWANRALEWSHGAMDHELTVYIMARKANIAGDMGDPLHVLDLGTAAENMAHSGSRLAAVAATFTAHGYALQGDRNGTQRAYDKAREMLGTMDADPSSPWGVWLDEPYIDVHRNRSLAALGEYRQAAEGYEVAITKLPADFRRDRGVYLARAARAYAGAEDADHAADAGLQALSIGVETKSGRILTELAQLDEALSRSQSPHVATFRQAMADIIARQI